MNPTFATDDRHPRERLDSRFRGNKEKERQLVEIFGFILGQALRNGLMMRDRCSRTRALRPRHLRVMPSYLRLNPLWVGGDPKFAVLAWQYLAPAGS